ncbi:hypothetical protein JCM12856_00600 [Spirochaeta dissipatitropha]
MEFTDISEVFRLKISRELTEQQKSDLLNRLGELPGVEIVNLVGSEIRLNYYPHAVSDQDIRAAIIEVGAVENLPKKKNPIARFIDRLARDNQESFGGRRMDCCDLPGKD